MREYRSGWNIDKIKADRLALATERFPAASPDVLAHIADIETSLYTLAYPLNGLQIEAGPHRVAFCESKLFPLRPKEGETSFMRFCEETRTTVTASIAPSELHLVEYYCEESLPIYDSTEIDDDFEIISVGQSAIATSINCGSICMGDVRRAADLLWPQAEGER